jgi:hypothetical protein
VGGQHTFTLNLRVLSISQHTSSGTGNKLDDPLFEMLVQGHRNVVWINRPWLLFNATFYCRISPWASDSAPRVTSIAQRKGVWRRYGVGGHGALANVALRLLSMHATSAAKALLPNQRFVQPNWQLIVPAPGYKTAASDQNRSAQGPGHPCITTSSYAASSWTWSCG